MKLSQRFFDETQNYITPSELKGFLYCKRFVYFSKALGIEQSTKNRYKVQKGRDVHEQKEMTNKEYLRKNIEVSDKKIAVELFSKEYKLKGIVDEVLTLSDGTMAPLDYKFAVYEDVVYETYKTQLVMYALMISETFEKTVEKGYIVYTRSNNFLKEIDITSDDVEKLKNDIKAYSLVASGYFPNVKKSEAKCLDCCYNNICIK